MSALEFGGLVALGGIQRLLFACERPMRRPRDQLPKVAHALRMSSGGLSYSPRLLRNRSRCTVFWMVSCRCPRLTTAKMPLVSHHKTAHPPVPTQWPLVRQIWRPGEHVIEQGDEGRAFFIIKSGEAKRHTCGCWSSVDTGVTLRQRKSY